MPARKRGGGNVSNGEKAVASGGGGGGGGGGSGGGKAARENALPVETPTTAATTTMPSPSSAPTACLPEQATEKEPPKEANHDSGMEGMEGVGPAGGYADPAAAERALQAAEAMIQEMDEGLRQKYGSGLHGNPAAVVNGRFRRVLLSFLLPCMLIGSSLFIASSKTKSKSRTHHHHGRNNKSAAAAAAAAASGEIAPEVVPEVVLPSYVEREALHYVQCVVANTADSMAFFSDFLGGEPWKVTSAKGAQPSAVNFGNSNVLLSEAAEGSEVTAPGGSPCRLVLRMARTSTLEKLEIKLQEKLASRPEFQNRVVCEALETTPMQHRSLRCRGPQQEIVEFSVFSSEATAAETSARKAWSARAADPRGRDLFE